MTAYSPETSAEFVRRYWPSDDGLPKHERLRQAFTASIADGFWSPGARLPTESELASATPCSLGTVQRALRDLVADGIIQRRRGSGTVVSDLRRHIEEPWHMRFLDRRGGPGTYLPVYTRVLNRTLLDKEGPWSEAINQNGRRVVKIDRIFGIADALEAYSVFYTLADRFPELAERPLKALDGTNFKNFIARRYQLPVHKVRQRMRFETPPSWVVSGCDWPPGASATVLNVVAYSLSGEAMYYQDFYMPPTDEILDLGTPTRA